MSFVAISFLWKKRMKIDIIEWDDDTRSLPSLSAKDIEYELKVKHWTLI
jgi:hypothetical protein